MKTRTARLVQDAHAWSRGFHPGKHPECGTETAMHWEIADDGAVPAACWCGLSWSHTPAERAALTVDVWPPGIPRPRAARSHAALAGLASVLD